MDESRIELAKYRLEKAHSCLQVSKLNMDNGYYADSANRSYYAIVHAARAVMALDAEDRCKHSGVMAYFREHYIKTGILDKKLSDIIQDAFQIRQISDYEDFMIFAYEDVEEQLEDANYFYNEVKRFVTETIAGIL